jgi:hypothetical protein
VDSLQPVTVLSVHSRICRRHPPGDGASFAWKLPIMTVELSRKRQPEGLRFERGAVSRHRLRSFDTNFRTERNFLVFRGFADVPETESVVLNAKHTYGAKLGLPQNKTDCFKMSADLQVIDGTVAFRGIAAAPIEFCRAIKSHLAAAPNGRIKLNVDCVLQHPRYYAFPFSDIGFDHVRDRSAFVIGVATDVDPISDLKLRGIHTPDFCLSINPKHPGEQFIFDGNGVRSTRYNCSFIDGVRIAQTRPHTCGTLALSERCQRRIPEQDQREDRAERSVTHTLSL